MVHIVTSTRQSPHQPPTPSPKPLTLMQRERAALRRAYGIIMHINYTQRVLFIGENGDDNNVTSSPGRLFDRCLVRGDIVNDRRLAEPSSQNVFGLRVYSCLYYIIVSTLHSKVSYIVWLFGPTSRFKRFNILTLSHLMQK